MDKLIKKIKRKDPLVIKWYKEIRQILNRYNKEYPQNKILFTGSSSIRLWETLDKDMAPLQVLNHGFGGSRLYDSIYYAKKLVYPFNPKAIVVFSGTNDMHENQHSKSAEDTFILAKYLLDEYRTNLPNTPIYYLSINRCNLRINVAKEVDKFNDMMQEYLKYIDCITFIRTSEAFYNKNRLPDDKYFQEDRLHLNEKGYAIWTDIIKPILIKDLG